MNAEGRPNPYFSPTEEESARTSRIFAAIPQYVRDPDNVVLVVAKSENDNAVIYKYVETDTGVDIVPTWFCIHPPDAARHRAEGNRDLCSPLNMLENAHFGIRVTLSEGEFVVTLNQEKLRRRRMNLIMDEQGKPALVGDLDGIPCRIQHAYIQLRPGLLPDVEYIQMYGYSLNDGALIAERITDKTA
jgi:hypothetical protein